VISSWCQLRALAGHPTKNVDKAEALTNISTSITSIKLNIVSLYYVALAYKNSPSTVFGGQGRLIGFKKRSAKTQFDIARVNGPFYLQKLNETECKFRPQCQFGVEYNDEVAILSNIFRRQ
jgi:hypothetical protein